MTRILKEILLFSCLAAFVTGIVVAAASLLIVSLVSSGAGGRRGCGQAAAAAAAMVYRVRSAVSDSAGSGGTNCPPGRTQPAAGTR